MLGGENCGYPKWTQTINALTTLRSIATFEYHSVLKQLSHARILYYKLIVNRI